MCVGRRVAGGEVDLTSLAAGVTVDVTTLIAMIGVNAVTSEIATMTVNTRPHKETKMMVKPLFLFSITVT